MSPEERELAHSYGTTPLSKDRVYAAGRLAKECGSPVSICPWHEGRSDEEWRRLARVWIQGWHDQAKEHGR